MELGNSQPQDRFVHAQGAPGVSMRSSVCRTFKKALDMLKGSTDTGWRPQHSHITKQVGPHLGLKWYLLLILKSNFPSITKTGSSANGTHINE